MNTLHKACQSYRYCHLTTCNDPFTWPTDLLVCTWQHIKAHFPPTDICKIQTQTSIWKDFMKFIINHWDAGTLYFNDLKEIWNETILLEQNEYFEYKILVKYFYMGHERKKLLINKTLVILNTIVIQPNRRPQKRRHTCIAFVLSGCPLYKINTSFGKFWWVQLSGRFPPASTPSRIFYFLLLVRKYHFTCFF